MAVITILALAWLGKHLAKHAHASPVPAPELNTRDSRNCVQLKLPVQITAHNAIYDLVNVTDDVTAADFTVTFGTHNDNPYKILKNITISETYNIGAQLCTPTNGAKKDILQIATHGLGFDKRYWDVTIDPKQYSWVENVLDAGYSILSYDRLGCGESDKPDAYRVVQAPAELEVLHKVTLMARSGELLKLAQKAGLDSGSTKFNKYIHIGHSYGSAMTAGLLATYGTLSDGAILTGFIEDKYLGTAGPVQFAEDYAPDNNPELFGDLSAGYLIPGTKATFQTDFFSSLRNKTAGIGGFTNQLLNYGYSVRQAIAASEWVSQTQIDSGLAPDFKGPVQFVLGEYDWLICGGYCPGTFNKKQVEALYPKATDVGFYLQPGTGHGL